MDRRKVDKKGRVRLHIEIDKDIVDRFDRVCPHYGQLAAFVRAAMEQHLKNMEKDTKRLLDE